MSVYKGYTDKQNKATQKYKKENYARIIVDIPKIKKEEYRAKATAKGYTSLTAYIVDLIEGDK